MIDQLLIRINKEITGDFVFTSLLELISNCDKIKKNVLTGLFLLSGPLKSEQRINIKSKTMSNTFEILMNQLDMPLEMRSSSAFCMRRFKKSWCTRSSGLGAPALLCGNLIHYFAF